MLLADQILFLLITQLRPKRSRDRTPGQEQEQQQPWSGNKVEHKQETTSSATRNGSWEQEVEET